MSKLGSEKYSVQKPIIDYVQEPSAEYTAQNGARVFLKLGWEYISPDEALRLRGGETGMVFKEVFSDQLQKLNPDFKDSSMAEEIVKKIESVPSNIEGNFIVWEYLKGLKTVFVPGEKRERNIKLLDTENLDNNVFTLLMRLSLRTEAKPSGWTLSFSSMVFLFCSSKQNHPIK